MDLNPEESKAVTDGMIGHKIGQQSAGDGNTRRQHRQPTGPVEQTAEQQKEQARKRALRDYRVHMVKSRKLVASTQLKAKGASNKVVKTMLKDLDVSDSRCAKFISKIDNIELADKTLQQVDIEHMESESNRIEANSKAVDALLASV